jgi:uncharacterized protein YcnI
MGSLMKPARIEMFRPCALTAIVFLLSALPANAHVTLEQRQASPGTFYKAVFSVPHGCDGSPTVRLRVTIPDGVILVKPMVKPGWKIEMVRGPYPAAYSALHGAKQAEGAREVVWSGGQLPDSFYDEFVLTTFISGDLVAGGTLHFPVIQSCEKGEHRWIETTSGSGHSDDPAPALKLLPQSEEARR